jgi:hypothetical protein
MVCRELLRRRDSSILTPTFAQILELSVAERLQLVKDIWDSIVASPDQLTAPEMLENPAVPQVKQPQLRRPHPAIGGKDRTVGDLISPIVEELEWK